MHEKMQNGAAREDRGAKILHRTLTRTGGLLMKKIIDELGYTERQVKQILLNKGKHKPKVLERYMTENDMSFAIVSDTHLCSRHAKMDELHTFYEICRKSGIQTIFHAGDIIDGNGSMYRGNLNELTVYGATRQVEYVANYYPRVDGIQTYFITGNHCNSFFNDNGIDIGDLIASKRPDMKYLGKYAADFMLNKVKIRLVHPDKAGAYSISYHAQKFCEQIQSGHKPDILIFGHRHVSLYFFYRNMHIFEAGTFQAQSDYLLRKGINPAIGGWICEVKEGKKDAVVAMNATFVPFFD